MKVVSFSVPKTSREAFRIQADKLPYFYDKLHEHPEIQITLILKGEGTLIAGDYVGRFKSNEIYILGNHQPHVFRNDEHYYEKKTNGVHSISLYFDKTYLGENFWNLIEMKPALQFIEKTKKGFKVKGKTKVLLESLIQTIPSQKNMNRIISFLEMMNILCTSKELESLGVAAQHETYNPTESKRMNELLHFTFTESNRKIYIREAASIANLSTEAFCRYFKLRTRKTYTRFLNEVRISNACRLLQTKEASVQQVCFDVGFNNLSHFNRIFKKILGQTPRSYMKL